MHLSPKQVKHNLNEKKTPVLGTDTDLYYNHIHSFIGPPTGKKLIYHVYLIGHKKRPLLGATGFSPPRMGLSKPRMYPGTSLIDRSQTSQQHAEVIRQGVHCCLQYLPVLTCVIHLLFSPLYIGLHFGLTSLPE